jgi:hypothetical protein
LRCELSTVTSCARLSHNAGLWSVIVAVIAISPVHEHRTPSEYGNE